MKRQRREMAPKTVFGFLVIADIAEIAIEQSV